MDRKHNIVSQLIYRKYKGDLIRASERDIVDILSVPAANRAELLPETVDWLRCQSIIRKTVSDAVNGYAEITIPSAVYYLIVGSPSVWRGRNRIKDDNTLGPYSSNLRPYLTGDIILEDLVNSFREASTFLNNPPEEIAVTSESVAVSTDSKNNEHPSADKFRKLYEPLSNDVSVYLHGSAAIGDYTAFSDIDDYVVVHESAFESIDRFREIASTLRKGSELLQQTDPLQHHGHWVFTDFDLQCLNQSKLPLIALKKARLLHGSPELNAQIRTDDPGFDDVLWGIVQDTREGYRRLIHNDHNLFTLKQLVSSISLLPAIVQQVCGNHLSKKVAIERSSEIFSDMAIQAIDWATEIRRDWHTIDGFSRIPLLQKLYRVAPFRRPVLEKISQKVAPDIPTSNIPHLTNNRINAVATLSDEAAIKLMEDIR